MELLKLVQDRFVYKAGGLYYKKDGKKAGYLNTIGYWVVMINSKAYLEHRLIYLLHNGTLPQFIDHINRQRNDNRIENFRPATKSQNQINMNAPVTNTSGIKCVRLDSRRGKWYTEVKREGKKFFLGYHPTKEDAVEAFLSFTKRHDGDFSNA